MTQNKSGKAQPTREELQAAKRARRKLARQARRQAVRAERRAAPQPYVAAMNRVKTHLNRGVHQGHVITKMMMLPGESQLVRLPTQDMPPVAVTRLRQIRNFDEVGPRDDFGDNTYAAIAYGQPSLTHMDGPYIYQTTSSVDLYFAVAGQTGTVASLLSNRWDLPVPTGGVATVQVLALEAPWPLANAMQTSTLLQPRRPLLSHNGKMYTWMNAGEELWVNAGVVTGGGFGNIELSVSKIIDAHSPPVDVKTDVVTWSAGQIIPSLIGWQEYGWYSVTVERMSVTSGIVESVSISMNVNCKPSYPYYKLNYVPELETTTTIGNDCRRTAMGLLVSNRSNMFTAQGNVVAARLDAKFPSGAGDSHIWDVVSRAKDSYSGNAQKGCYTYMEFDFADEAFSDVVNEWGCPIVKYPSGMMNVITINNTGTQRNTYTIVCDIVLEFKSQSQLFPAAVSGLSNAELIEARRINNMTTYFYENPLHWADIQKYIERMWEWTRKHSNGIGTAVSMVYPELAPAVMPIARMLQK